MQIRRLELDNWKNFRSVDLPLQQRVFIIGPNAAGKSNLLDAVRFIRDIADPEGGFVRAVRSRGGVSQLRCLHARKLPNVAVGCTVTFNGDEWGYRVEFKQDQNRRPVIVKETVCRAGQVILDRPDDHDREDPSRLSQTHLEQVTANRAFRELAGFLADIRYLHVVPQLIRDPKLVVIRSRDPYGSDFLAQVAKTNKRTLQSRLRRINEALRVAVPQLRELKLEADERGVPHLRGLYEHWRPNAGWQSEDQFSDGTLRLLGLLWALLDGTRPLLLEEPELSLHAAVVQYLPILMHRVARKAKRQIIVSTHSADLLSDQGIGPEEIVMLMPSRDGTTAELASAFEDVRALVESGLPIGTAVLPKTAPKHAQQLALFEA